MSDEQKGHLVVTTAVLVPDETDNHYKAMNHHLKVKDVPILDRECTRAEATELIARLRNKNSPMALSATWVGSQQL